MKLRIFVGILGFPDFRVDFSDWISGFQNGFLDFTWISGFHMDFWISVWISADSVRDFFRDGSLEIAIFGFGRSLYGNP